MQSGGNSKDFKVALSRGSNGLFGFRVDADWSQSALVLDWVDEAGAIGTWNRQNPGNPMRPGDRLVAVNNVKGDPEKMRVEIMNATYLMLTVSPGDAPRPL